MEPLDLTQAHHRTQPFLVQRAERREGPSIVGMYDETKDVWTVEGELAVASKSFLADTLTLTKASGESTDRD